MVVTIDSHSYSSVSNKYIVYQNMERPKLRDFSKGTLASLDKHQIALIEWSWWAEERIKEQDKQLSIKDIF